MASFPSSSLSSGVPFSTLLTGTPWLLATSNPGKLREFQAALPTVTLRTLADVGIDTLPPETGTTFAANALIKARYGCVQTQLPTLADDSGLCVDVLNGAPGIYSARYGNQPSDAERTRYLLERLQPYPQPKDRQAAFVCALALVLPKSFIQPANADALENNTSDGASAEYVFEGRARGTIVYAPQGTQGFGYDPVFYCPTLAKTFGEATLAEKQRVSHRHHALVSLQTWLERLQ